MSSSGQCDACIQNEIIKHNSYRTFHVFYLDNVVKTLESAKKHCIIFCTYSYDLTDIATSKIIRQLSKLNFKTIHASVIMLDVNA